MKRIALLLMLMVCSCSETSPESRNISNQDVIAPAYEHSLSDSELHLMEGHAQNGDVMAALALANHYAYAEMDHASAKRWYTVAADGGSIPAMQAMAIYLSESGLGSDCDEAVNWIEKAIEHASDEQMVQNFRLRESLAELKKKKCVKDRQPTPN